MSSQNNDSVCLSNIKHLAITLSYTPQTSRFLPSSKAAETADWLSHILSENESGQYMSTETQARAESLRYICSLSVRQPLADLCISALGAVKHGRHEIESLIRIDRRRDTAGLKWLSMAEDYVLTRYAPYSKKIEAKRKKMEEEKWIHLFNGRKSGGPIIKCPYETSAVFAVMDWVDIDRILDYETTREGARWTDYPGISAFVDFSTKLPGRQPPSKLTAYVESVAKSCGDENWRKVRKFIKTYIAHRYPASPNLYTETNWFEAPLLFLDAPMVEREMQKSKPSTVGGKPDGSEEIQRQRRQKFEEDSQALSEWTPSCCDDDKILAKREMTAFKA
ncbi:hypothetical protein CORC01_07293 [Colletotrichum orchidophilum]|uniref:Uncharacterized protein n=1 Tax=Colletotrichum orchidophilum TaxID=1209926 RepID=A0A1G4B7F7_9PEZI|nr:uncharacterized protein CORC01_07293 [Colletotrichum orchidophilum]OHE97388.1 hypothetical protein CORC01_07293 [Colletotrichum orchidophilum]